MDGEGGEYGRYQETYFLRAMPGFFCFRFACEDQPASEIGGVLNCDFKPYEDLCAPAAADWVTGTVYFAEIGSEKKNLCVRCHTPAVGQDTVYT